MKLAVLRLAALGAFTTVSMGAAHAGLINFIALTDSPGGLGESAWTTLTLSSGSVSVDIRGYASNDNDNQQYAYLDFGNAGLGVCKDLLVNPPAGSSTNKCSNSADDNTNLGEWLSFKFNKDVLVSNLWFNSNHDDAIQAGDKVSIAGGLRDLKTGYAVAGDTNGIGSYLVPKNTEFLVAYYNQQFYMSGMEVSEYGGGIPGGVPTRVPEPASLALAGLALCGLAATRRRRA